MKENDPLSRAKYRLYLKGFGGFALKMRALQGAMEIYHLNSPNFEVRRPLWAKPDPSGSIDDQAAEIRRLKRDLIRVTEECDILN